MGAAMSNIIKGLEVSRKKYFFLVFATFISFLTIFFVTTSHSFADGPGIGIGDGPGTGGTDCNVGVSSNDCGGGEHEVNYPNPGTPGTPSAPPTTGVGATVKNASGYVDFFNNDAYERVGLMISEPPARAECSSAAGAVGAYAWSGARVSVTWRIDTISQEVVVGSGRILGIKCIPMKKTVENLECVVGISTQIDMLAPTRKTIAPHKYKSSAYDKKQNMKNCVSSQGLSDYRKASITEYGRYHAYAQSTTQRVQNVTFSSRVPGSNFSVSQFSVQGPRVLKPMKNNYAQQTCGEFLISTKRSSAFKGDPTFTQDDCPTTAKGSFECTASDTTWINGQKAKTATVFRDGEANNVTFSVPKLSGDTFVKKSQSLVKTRIFRTGTPWDDSATKAKTPLQITKKGSSTPLKINSKDRSSYTSGGINSYDVHGYLASEAKDPTKLRNEYVLEGKWKVETKVIQAFFADGSITVVDGPTRTITSTATCMSPEVSLNFVRGVNAY